MRTIKFRAWSKDTKEIIPWEECFFPEWLEDDNIVMMQYTGLKDKSGKEIYEGDIYRCKRLEILPEKGKYIKEVSWHLDQGWGISQDWAEEFEIIGNIHENQDLLH